MRFSRLALLLTGLFLTGTGKLSAQILNIDREDGRDTLNRRWMVHANLDLSTDKQKYRLINLDLKTEIDRLLCNDYVFIFQAGNDLVFNGRESIQNEGMLHLRFRDNDTRTLSPEEFIQYQWNGALGMEYRFLTGANARFRWFDREKKDLYTGLGLFRESEKWNWSAVEKGPIPPDSAAITRTIWRLNHYWKYATRLNPQLDISTASFLQFPLNNHFWNPRWYWECNLYVNAGTHFSFLIHWDQILDHYRVVPVASFYYGFATGLQYHL